MLVLDNLQNPDKAVETILSIIAMLGITAIAITLVSKNGKGSLANFGHFAGMLLMFGGIVAALIVLMDQFKNIKNPMDFIKKVGPALIVIGLIIGAVDRHQDVGNFTVEGGGAIDGRFANITA